MFDLARYVINWDDYERKRRCGKGAFSSVYQYEERATKKLVAVKCMEKDIDKPQFQMMFLREVSILLSLQHPAILNFVGFSLPKVKGEPLCIATDFMSRGTLQTLEDAEHQGKHIPDYDGTRKSIIMFGIAVGMAHIHRNNVCHRDLKAENIFLDEHLEPKIADFGLSKVSEQTLKMSATVGTPYYMAPELFNTEEQSTFAIDVYAYAVILLSIVNQNDFKFPGINLRAFPQLVALVRQGNRFAIPGLCSEPVKELIEECWDQNPTKRPSFDEIVQSIHTKEICFAGTDLLQYRRYREKILAWKPQEIAPDEPSTERTENFIFD
jgi:serine/threonine protein kinase